MSLALKVENTSSSIILSNSEVEKRDHFPDISAELFSLIISTLDVRSCVRCSLISHQWKDWSIHYGDKIIKNALWNLGYIDEETKSMLGDRFDKYKTRLNRVKILDWPDEEIKTTLLCEESKADDKSTKFMKKVTRSKLKKLNIHVFPADEIVCSVYHQELNKRIALLRIIIKNEKEIKKSKKIVNLMAGNPLFHNSSILHSLQTPNEKIKEFFETFTHSRTMLSRIGLEKKEPLYLSLSMLKSIKRKE